MAIEVHVRHKDSPTKGDSSRLEGMEFKVNRINTHDPSVHCDTIYNSQDMVVVHVHVRVVMSIDR